MPIFGVNPLKGLIIAISFSNLLQIYYLLTVVVPVEFKKFVNFKVYGDLNDFLPQGKKHKEQQVGFWGTPTVKKLVESIGVAHVEVFLILADSLPVNDYRPANETLISYYPKFTSLSISAIALRPDFEKTPRFILDVHLG